MGLMRRWPAGERVGHERLEVGRSAGRQADVGLPHSEEVGGDGAGRAVLGVQGC
jgi:hypothetical protein